MGQDDQATEQEPGRVQLFLLGSLRLVIGDRVITGISPMLAELLSFLALNTTANRVIDRGLLLSNVWAHLPKQRGRRGLSDALYRLRTMFGDKANVLVVEKSGITLRKVWVDVDEFRRLVASSELSAWRAAIDLYRGDLLPDVDAEWLEAVRASLHDDYILLLTQVCADLNATGAYSDALSYTQRWIRADPFSEEAYRYAMRLNARLGRHAVALRQYEHLTKVLGDELGLEPMVETQSLAAAIRVENSIAPADLFLPTPLIGRRYEYASLVRRVEEVQEGRGGIVLLDGETGIGKTHLLSAVTEGASWRGTSVVLANATPQHGLTTYEPLPALLGEVSRAPRSEQLNEQLPIDVRAALRGLAPALSIPDEVTKQKEGAIPSVKMLATALTSLFAVLSELGPHLLVLDDLQWAGTSFWRMIAFCAPSFHHSRLLLVLSFRGNELRADKATWAIVRELDREVVPLRINLRGLNPDECGQMARSLSWPLSSSQVQRLTELTGGNPLFVEQVVATRALDSPPLSLRELIDRRLDALPEPVRRDVEAAAILGREFRYRHWRALAGATVASSARALLDAGLLTETERGYSFRADLMRERLYTGLSAEHHRNLHRRAAATIFRDSDDPALAAWHYTQAESWTEAARCYQLAADRAASDGLPQLALEQVKYALELLGRVPRASSERQALLARWHELSALVASRRERVEGPGMLVVQIARLGAPLTRALSEGDTVKVRWTIDDGAEDIDLLRREGKVALRRHRILRLVAEAKAQGGAPSDGDLARALGVTERTIGSDIAALEAAGIPIETRRRRRG
jgi:DNA-binding SARP family transcriptional activator/DNA-binding transcriptional ArsR family regulator